MINFAVINLKSTIKNLCKIIIVLLLIIGIVNLSDLIRNTKIDLNYIDLVKSCIDYNFNDINSMDSLEKIVFNQEMPILAASNNIIDNSSENENQENMPESLPKTGANMYAQSVSLLILLAITGPISLILVNSSNWK